MPTKIYEQSVSVLPGIGAKRVKTLADAGLDTVRDILMYLPRGYSDRSKFIEVAAIAPGDRATIDVRVVRSRYIRLRGRLNMAEVTFSDSSGSIKATWFGQGYLARAFTEGKRAILTGEAGNYNGLTLKNPEYEILEEGDDDRTHTGRIVPIYRLSGTLRQRELRSWIHAAIESFADALPEILPENLRASKGFQPVATDLRQVHFPDSMDLADKALRRFAYEELFALQTKILRLRAFRLEQELGVQHRIDGPQLRALRRSLPFRPTAAQARVTDAILRDMQSARPMARLLQGDVGSGKTLVALHAAAASIDSGMQAAIMAPTELLAEQHAATAARYLGPLGISIALLTGAASPGKKETLKAIAAGRAELVVGTHALFQDRTEFANLGLVIVDEQHRFGVQQRDKLAKKGRYPDLLQMTATPIPRTLALTVYGAMDISVLDELPPGRSPIATRRLEESGLDGLYDHIRVEAAAGRQSFIICPLVEESDKRALRAVTTHFEQCSQGPLAGLRTALVHGRLSPDEKDATMRSFASGRIDVLFATSVIEVGIDVPNASTIAIEDAASFGLTQLHQLRGRVGRGEHVSHCFLLGTPATEDGAKRLETLCRTNDGFEIAEADLVLRGSGQIYGLRQHGESDLRVADLVRDARLIEEARSDAEHHLRDEASERDRGPLRGSNS